MTRKPAATSAKSLATPSATTAAPAPAPPLPAGSLEGFLTYRLHLLHKLSDRASHALYLRESGLPLGEARCLAALGSADAQGVNALAARANLDKAQASRAAQSLIDQGLASKAPSAVDGRGVVLALTPAGRARWHTVMALVARRNAEIFGVLSGDEQRQLGEWFDRLIAAAAAAGAGAGAAAGTETGAPDAEIATPRTHS